MKRAGFSSRERTVVGVAGRFGIVAWSGVGALAGALAVSGCATRADLLQQERKLSGMIEQQSRSLDALKRDIEAMREERVPRGSAGSTRPLAKTPARPREKMADQPAPPASTLAPDQPIGQTLAPDAAATDQAQPSPAPSDTVVAAVPSAPAAAPPPSGAQPAGVTAGSPSTGAAREAVDEDWKREVAQDRAVAIATGAPERAQYVKSLEGLAKGDCAKAIPGLRAVSANSKGSPLSDNAIYWQARCLAARGDDHKAVTRLNEVVVRYPKSDKAPAALWEQGQLQLRSGSGSAARATFARLIRDYPASAEAGRARRKLAEIPD